MRTGVLRPRDVSMGNRWAFRAEVKGCRLDIGLQENKIRKKSRVLSFTCVNGGYLMSELSIS